VVKAMLLAKLKIAWRWCSPWRSPEPESGYYVHFGAAGMDTTIPPRSVPQTADRTPASSAESPARVDRLPPRHHEPIGGREGGALEGIVR